MKTPILYSILRAKAGEVSGVAALSPGIKPFVRFVFDFPVIDGDEADGGQFTGALVDLARGWGTSLPLYLDLSRFDPNSRTAEGTPLVAKLFEVSRQAHLLAIPVAGPLLDRGGAASSYLESVKRIASLDRRGAALRIPFHDFLEPSVLIKVIHEIQDAIQLEDALCDVLLDAGPTDAVPGGYAAAYALLRETFSEAAEALQGRHFRALIACASSIPKKSRTSSDGSPTEISNIEFQVWSELINKKSLRRVRFGDYGARFAYQTDTKQKAQAPARIHLTTSKSHTLYVAPASTYRELAMRAAKSEAFSQQLGTWGKYSIADAAEGRAGAGNSTDWVARDTHTRTETLVHAVMNRIRETEGASELEIGKDSPTFGQQYLPLEP